MNRFFPTLLLCVACSGSDDPPSSTLPDGAAASCADGETYPADVVEPMALGEALAAYRWPDAIHRQTGVRTALDLAGVPCNTQDIDWSPFDVLLFVSIPAW